MQNACMEADLDVFDLRLLAALQTDGRAAASALADRVGLSPSQISRRLARLEEDGVIERYAALLKPEAVGLSVLAFSNVSLERHAEDLVHGFEAAVMNWPEILECYSVTGEADFVLRIVAGDLKAFADFLMLRLLRIPGVRSARSSIVLHRIKQTTALPLKSA
jgi:Lrp/AsnC family leucine-responsive transcriptional regulator